MAATTSWILERIRPHRTYTGLLIALSIHVLTRAEARWQRCRLTALRGKIVFVNFLGQSGAKAACRVWIGCKKIYHDVALSADFGFLAIHAGPPDRGKPSPQVFLKQRGYTYPTLLDRESALTDSYDWIPLVNSLPKYILFDRAGHILHRYGESDHGQVVADKKFSRRVQNNSVKKSVLKAPKSSRLWIACERT